MREPVSSGHQRDRAQSRHVVLGADPDQHIALGKRCPQQFEQGHPALQHVHQRIEVGDVTEPVIAQQARGPLHVQGPLPRLLEFGEDRRERV